MTSAGEVPNAHNTGEPVDIIVPVHTPVGLVRACLESVLDADNRLLGDIIVVEDCSPDSQTRPYLEELAKRGRIRLELNDQNEGFVRSVLQGAAINPERDFIILNSDTAVAGNWLDRLVAHARGNGQVATVTPFSNNATIASYPTMGAENPMPANITLDELDGIFAQVNAGKSVVLPTGIGFCMYIARQAWQEAGGFDESYGRGYGEEVDFCCQLALDGWQHLLAGDVFVFHEGNASFGDGADALKAHAQTVVDERFPEYSMAVQEWVAADPAMDCRLAVDLERLRQSSAPRILFVSHILGGGVQQHVEELTRLLQRASAAEVFVLTPRGIKGVQLKWMKEGTHLEWAFDAESGEQALISVARALDFTRIHFHHFIGLPPWVMQLPGALALPYDFTAHDFQAACPQISFLDESGKFCGRPDLAGCRDCVATRPDQWGLGIEEWRRRFGGLLAGAERAICPGDNVAEVLKDYFPGVSLSVWPHFDSEVAVFQNHLERSLSRTKVALIGSLSRLKGLKILEQMAIQARDQGMNVHFSVIGPVQEPINAQASALISVLGSFAREELPDILANERPDAILFLSRVPETFSYALSIAMSTGLPVLGPNLGAIGERLAAYDRGVLLEPALEPSQVLAALSGVSSAYTSHLDTSYRWQSGVDADDYLQRYISAFDDGFKAFDVDEEACSLLGGAMRASPASQWQPRSVEDLYRAGVECSQLESRDQLRRQAIANEKDLVVAKRHLDIRGKEVEHLKSVVGSLKEANKKHVDSLEERIKEQFASLKERDVELRRRSEAISELSRQLDAFNQTTIRLEKEIETVEQQVVGWQAEAERLSLQLADREKVLKAVAIQLRTMEQSTIWRATAPLRRVLAFMKRVLHRWRNGLSKSKRLLTFVRYHYSVGGASGLRSAVGRRLSGGGSKQQQEFDGNAAATTNSIEDLPQGPVTLQTSDSDPQVSVLIPSYGQHEVTANCLRSIAANPPSARYEVLVLDDAYETAFKPEAFAISGVRVIRNPENLGFLRTCNKGVAETSGAFVLLLNNDTLVHAGALDALVDTFDKFENAGAVGAKLLFADGVLQEAGGIVWRDGSAWNWGRNEDATDPRFNYVRDADYCSAAALMVKRSVWEEIGGFDDNFAPAYYEDTDFCFEVKAHGYRVLYQPTAVVTHLEGVSHGTDTSEGMKAYQVENAKKFANKWQERLARHAPNGQTPMLERDRGAKLRILWVEACVLTPDQDSGSLRTLRLLKILVNMGCKVTFVADNLQNHQPYVEQLEAEGIEVLHTPQVTSVSGYIKSFGADFDVITLCRHYIAIKYVDQIREQCPKTQIWFDTIDLHYLRLRRQYALDNKSATKSMADLAYGEEMKVIAKSDITIVVSDVEVEELAKEAPGARVAVVSNIHEVYEGDTQFEGREHIMFVGGFQHPPNIDAVEFFAEEIWPEFRRRHPDTKAFIIGSKMPDSLKQFGEEHGLDMLGFVEDLTPYYENCVMAIAPLRYGAGVKGKVNQALSFGLPVVGTAAAVEGMGLVHREEAMCADDPAAFVDAMDDVMTDAELWRTLSVRGQASLARAFSTDVAEKALGDMLAPILRPR